MRDEGRQRVNSRPASPMPSNVKFAGSGILRLLAPPGVSLLLVRLYSPAIHVPIESGERYTCAGTSEPYGPIVFAL